MKTILLALTLFLSTSLLADDYDKRLEAAYRYLEARPVSELWNKAIAEMIKASPYSEKNRVRRIKDYGDLKNLEKGFLEHLTNEFTAEELNTLADFFGSEAGRSAWNTLQKVRPKFSETLLTELQKAQRAEALGQYGLK